MPPKNQRRSHTKSKKGCSQCKVRRIKCNEAHPVCNNCERRQITCDFSLSPNTSRSPSHNNERSGEQECRPTAVVGGQPTPALSATDPFGQPDLVSTKKTTELDITDLKLMHHFTSVVSVDLANAQTEEASALWQIHCVKLGFKHNFLLRGILAVSAFHMSYIRPDKKSEYDLIGNTHQSIGLTEFQETLQHVDESNCHALFAFSCLIIVLAFASSSKDKPRDFATDVLHWFYLLRGANIVLNMHSESIKNSFLKPLLDEMSHVETTPAHEIADTDQITKLFRICTSRNHDEETAQAYNLAIHSLLSTFVQASLMRNRGDTTVLTTFIWPINLPPKFLDLLSEKTPEALIILAHYCVLIAWAESKGEDQTWFMGGWARYMFETVREEVAEEWQPHLGWPGLNIL